jgi:hypothetical protein
VATGKTVTRKQAEAPWNNKNNNNNQKDQDLTAPEKF